MELRRSETMAARAGRRAGVAFADSSEEAQQLIFLYIMAAGLIGLLLMALPGMQQHGHAGIAPHSHGGLRLGHGHGAPASGNAVPGAHAAHALPQAAGGTHGAGAARGITAGEGANPGFEMMRLIPSPRAIFSILTLYGAFGYAFYSTFHVWMAAALIALVPAIAIELLAVRPLWNLMFRFQGVPTTPIEGLVLCEAKAVTPFRNGKGIVAIEHDGQIVQFSARLQESHSKVPVKVGDSLCVEDVDSAKQRMLVSVKQVL